MLAIQNQISVLTKILETKMQQQQIIEYQQAVSASLTKMVSPTIQQQQRSRKISNNSNNNTDNSTSSQCGEKNDIDLKLNDNKSCLNVNQTNLNNIDDDNNIIPESTGCIIS